jgi:hypothetical protein
MLTYFEVAYAQTNEIETSKSVNWRLQVADQRAISLKNRHLALYSHAATIAMPKSSCQGRNAEFKSSVIIRRPLFF